MPCTSRLVRSIRSKINQIHQKSDNLVNQNVPKFTKIAWTQWNEINQNEAKWPKIDQN